MDEQNTKPVRPWDLINPNIPKVSDKIQEERFSICLSCPKLIQITKTCSECKCFMVLKTRLLNATCPINKW